MKQHLPLGYMALASILAILLIVVGSSSLSGLVIDNHRFLSDRLCPPGTQSVYRSSPPLYPGGPAEQLNVVCVSKDRPIEAEGKWFEHNYVAPFDRFNQDRINRRYD